MTNNIVRKKILIVAPSWVGDMMMAHVLFQLLHQQNPGCELHVLAPLWSEALLSRMSEITKSIVLPFNHGELKLRARFQFAKKLKQEKYDQAIVLPNSLKSALIPFFAGISVRTGWLGEYRFGFLNDARSLDKKLLPTMVMRFAALAFARNAILPSHLPNPQLTVSSDNIERTLDKYQLKNSAQKKILALCPGAEFGPSKCWPAKYFADVANQKIKEGWSVWIFGSKNDAKIGDEIQTFTNHQCENLCGKTALSEAVDLLSLSTCVISNDSGLMHIAAALNRSLIAIYGSTSPIFTPPLSTDAKILKLALDCQPCFQRQCPLKHHQCMKQLLPQKVLGLVDG